MTSTISYDSDLRPTAITVPNVENLSFGYDLADRITNITNGLNGSNTQTLGYDALDRLTSVTSPAETASYTYDADGNRTHQVYNGVSTTFTYAPTSNRLVSASGGVSASYGYNAYGSTTTINGLAAYTYDPFGRLANAGGAGFLVSAEDQRLRKTSASGTTYFAPDAGGAMLAESLNGTWYDYVWLNGRLVTVIANGGVFPVHADQTGRPLALTHPTTKAILWQAAGLAFDRNVTQNNWGPFNVGFPGQYWDSEDGLWQNGYRDYDAATGRYIESDPIGLLSGVNTYAYVGGDPISTIDPLGLLCFDFNKFADEIRDNRLSTVLGKLGQAVTAGNLASTLANTPFSYPRAGAGTAAGSPTSLLSRLGMRFRVKLPIRVFGTTNALRALGRFGVVSTIAEGAWDLGIEVKSAVDATSTKDCGCKKN